MKPTTIIIIFLTINFVWTYYLSKQIINPKRYYLHNDGVGTVSYIRSNGALKYDDFGKRTRWSLPDAKKAQEVYPFLKIRDCATGEEVK